MRVVFWYGALFSIVATSIGCGQKELPTKQTYPVQGKVQLKGEPVAFAIVMFEPKGGKGFPATAYTDKDGAFSGARTFSNSEMDGMVPGEYEVKLEGYNPITSVKFFGPRPAEGETPTKIPPEVANTGETVTVEANDNAPIIIDLK
jgi:hypothetical protein